MINPYTIIFFEILLICIMAIWVNNRMVLTWKKAFLFMIPLILSILLVLFSLEQINTQTIYSDWKTIYQNNYQIDLKLTNLYQTEIQFGKPLGDNADMDKLTGKFQINAHKNDSFETREVHISPEDVIIEGELTSASQIIKVEYRKVKSQKYELWGTSVDVFTRSPDELKITVQTPPQITKEKNELRDLFDKED